MAVNMDSKHYEVPASHQVSSLRGLLGRGKARLLVAMLKSLLEHAAAATGQGEKYNI